MLIGGALLIVAARLYQGSGGGGGDGQRIAEAADRRISRFLHDGAKGLRQGRRGVKTDRAIAEHAGGAARKGDAGAITGELHRSAAFRHRVVIDIITDGVEIDDGAGGVGVNARIGNDRKITDGPGGGVDGIGGCHPRKADQAGLDGIGQAGRGAGGIGHFRHAAVVAGDDDTVAAGEVAPPAGHGKQHILPTDVVGKAVAHPGAEGQLVTGRHRRAVAAQRFQHRRGSRTDRDAAGGDRNRGIAHLGHLHGEHPGHIIEHREDEGTAVAKRSVGIIIRGGAADGADQHLIAVGDGMSELIEGRHRKVDNLPGTDIQIARRGNFVIGHRSGNKLHLRTARRPLAAAIQAGVDIAVEIPGGGRRKIGRHIEIEFDTNRVGDGERRQLNIQAVFRSVEMPVGDVPQHRGLRLAGRLRLIVTEKIALAVHPDAADLHGIDICREGVADAHHVGFTHILQGGGAVQLETGHIEGEALVDGADIDGITGAAEGKIGAEVVIREKQDGGLIVQHRSVYRIDQVVARITQADRGAAPSLQVVDNRVGGKIEILIFDDVTGFVEHDLAANRAVASPIVHQFQIVESDHKLAERSEP